MNLSAQEKLQLADKELNIIYQQILKEYKADTLFIQKLKLSQNLWIKFRDAELEMRFPEKRKQSFYGSVYPMCVYAILEELTLKRTITLKEWLEPVMEGEVCAGSKKTSHTK